MLIILILTISVAGLSFLGFKLYLLDRKQKLHAEELKRIREKLKQNLIDIDDFVSSLSNIHQFSLDVSSFKNREELSRNIMGSAGKLCGFETGSVMLLNPKTNKLEIVASKGLSPEIVSKTCLRIGEGIAGKVAETGNPVFIEDVTNDSRFLKEDSVDYSLKTLVSLPMEVNKKTIGVLNISPSRKKDVYDDKMMHLLSAFADECAVALGNVALYQNLQKSYIEIIKTLARVSDLKDSYSFNHADRLNKLAHFICRNLKLPKCISVQIEYAALIHDVGKIGVDRRILEKPAKLDEKERVFIEKHPAIGSNLIAPIPFLSSIAPMILYHQEWYNGKGYPEGLEGEEIPLGARIVAVIDAFDAMTSDRPYHKKMSVDEAVLELKRCEGTQFDPDVVDAFIDVVEKISLNKGGS